MIKLYTKRMILRNHVEADLESHHKLLSDDEVMYYLQDIKTSSFKESEENLFATINDMSSENRALYFFKMIEAETGNHIGEIGYSVTDFALGNRCVHVGYFTYKSFWGKGYATEALRDVIRFAFEQDNVFKISTGCIADNAGSEKVMLKCNFIKENEHEVLHDNKTKIRLEYSISREQWLKQ